MKRLAILGALVVTIGAIGCVPRYRIDEQAQHVESCRTELRGERERNNRLSMSLGALEQTVTRLSMQRVRVAIEMQALEERSARLEAEVERLRSQQRGGS